VIPGRVVERQGGPRGPMMWRTSPYAAESCGSAPASVATPDFGRKPRMVERAGSESHDCAAYDAPGVSHVNDVFANLS